MAFQYLTNVPLDEAREAYKEALLTEGFGAGTETVPVTGSCGRITSEPVYAAICAPHYPASAMDGIALKAGLTFGAGETTPATLTSDQFIVVDTGDPVPEGCDAVVMIEDVTTSGKSMEETVPIVRAQADVTIAGLMVSLNRSEKGKGNKTALKEVAELYGFPTAAIVSMPEVIEYLQEKGQLDQELKARLDAYYELYGAAE